MSNLAEQKVFPIRPDLQVVEQRVAELEDGYARLSNTLLEEYSGADLTKRHFKVLLAVLRLTYGWNKAMDRICDSQISVIAKLPVKKCNEAKLELIRMNVLVKNGKLLGPNKNVSEWNIPQSGGESPKTGDKTSPKTGVGYPPKRGDTKDIIPKKEIQNNKPPVVPLADRPVKPEKPKKRATQYPGDFTPSDGNIKLAGDLGVDLQSEAAAFADYHQSKGSTFTNWNLALNTWLRNAVKFGRKSQPVQRQCGSRSQPENFATKDYGQTEMPSWAQE